MVTLRLFLAVVMTVFSFVQIFPVMHDQSDLPIVSVNPSPIKGSKKLVVASREPLLPLVPSLNKQPKKLGPIQEIAHSAQEPLSFSVIQADSELEQRYLSLRSAECKLKRGKP